MYLPHPFFAWWRQWSKYKNSIFDHFSATKNLLHIFIQMEPKKSDHTNFYIRKLKIRVKNGVKKLKIRVKNGVKKAKNSCKKSKIM